MAVFAFVQIGQGKVKRAAVAGLRHLVNNRAAGVTPAVMFGHLVKRLARRVIDSSSQHRDVVKIIRPANNSVAA